MKARRSYLREWFIRPPAEARTVIRIVAGLALAVLVAFGPQTWRARALTNRFVSTSGDDLGGANDCANSVQPCKTLQNAINHSGSGDLIEVGPGTYFENVFVSQSVTILGDGLNGSTVNGNNRNPVFTINSGVTATLSTLTLTNGNGDDVGGGGISNWGVLTVTNCMIKGNSAGGSGFGGGISNCATLTVKNSTISGNSATTGGGISNLGTLIVTNSTISGNPVGASGGGILNQRFSTLSVTGSTISGNSAPDGGAGVSNVGTLTIANSTISGNLSDANGGGIDNQGALTIAASTISGNTVFGVLNFPNMTMNLTNTIIAGSCLNNNGTIGINDHNLIQSGNCSPLISADPQLGPLQDNGGPTFTQALLPGSPAIDAGDDSVLGGPFNLTTDQRGPGFPRKSGPHVDIGAFEVQFDTCLVDNSTGNLLQWNGTTGQYKFTRCSDGFTLSGTGEVGLVNGIRTLMDTESDRRIRARANTGEVPGTATIQTVTDGVSQTFPIIDTNPDAVCTCSG